MTLQLKHPLAFDVDRNPIAVPRQAVAWRVRLVLNGMLQTKRGGPAEPVNGPNGSPLYLEITASHSDLAKEVPMGGLYRLDAVDASLSVLTDVRPAYVEVTRHSDAVTALCLGALHGFSLPPPLPTAQETLVPVKA
jgi:hypothetical protein